MSFDADDLAYGIVEDYLDDGPEYIDIVNAVHDNADDPTDEQVAEVAEAVRELLERLRGQL